MKHDGVAPMRKVKILRISAPRFRNNKDLNPNLNSSRAAPMNRDLRQDLSASSFRSELKVEDKSSRSGEFKFKIFYDPISFLHPGDFPSILGAPAFLARSSLRRIPHICCLTSVFFSSSATVVWK